MNIRQSSKLNSGEIPCIQSFSPWHSWTMSGKNEGKSDGLNEKMKNCLLYGHSSDKCPCCASRYDRARPPKVNLKKTKQSIQEGVEYDISRVDASLLDESLLDAISEGTLNMLGPDDAAVNKSKLVAFNEVKYGFWDQAPYPVQTDVYRHELPSILPTLHPEDQNDSMIQEILYLVSIQKYINKLGFCREGEPKVKVDSTKSIRYQMETAKQIIKVSESIKCHQALVLGIYFTNCLSRNERFTISFKYAHKGKEYTHVVLGTTFGGGRYGAIGISRHAVLQKLNGPFIYDKVSGLINAFKNSYKKLGQILLEVKVGQLIPHDGQSLKHIGWEWRTLRSKSLEDPKEVARLDSDLEWRIVIAHSHRRHAAYLSLLTVYPYHYTVSFEED